MARREPGRERDSTLSAPARTWMEALPEYFRPVDLCAAYPRVANRVAMCWSDWALTDHVFEDLLVDARGSRRGFPPEVREDLLQLRRLSAQRIPSGHLQAARAAHSRDDKWALHLQSPNDRVGRR